MRTRNALIGMITGVIVLIATACNKEQIIPSEDNPAAAGAIGEAKKAGGSDCFALVGSGGGSELHLVDQGSRTMTFIANIVDPSGMPVDHFMGITWDPAVNCTWLVTNNTASDPAHQNLVWQIPGPLPTLAVGSLTAMPIAGLVDASSAVVKNAMDIECAPTGQIYLLRNDATGVGRRMAMLDPMTGLVNDLSGTPPHVQAFTFDCAGKLVAVRTNVATPRAYFLNTTTGAVLPGGTPTFSTGAFRSSDAGIEPGTGCTTMNIYGINAETATVMGTRFAPLSTTDPSLRPTYDMTTQ